MHKAVLILLLIVTNTSIAADEWNWVEIGKRINEKGIILTFYADLTTTSTENSKRKVWTLFEFSKQQGSIKQQEEYDCNQKTIKHLHRLNYYGNMGTGKFDVMTLTKEEQKFNPILPGHLSYTLLNIVCNVALEPVSVDWSKILEGYDETYYIDHSTIRKNGQFVTLWLLIDLKQRDTEKEFFSSKAQAEYACKDKKARLLTSIAYSDKMASGNIIRNFTKPTNWSFIRSNSPRGFVQSLVCHEWIKIAEGDKGSIYYDSSSIQKTGQFVTSWVLFDFKQRINNKVDDLYGALSVRTQFEYDCKGKNERIHYLTGHSDSMASGNILSGSTKTTAWEPIEEDYLQSIICDKE